MDDFKRPMDWLRANAFAQPIIKAQRVAGWRVAVLLMD